MFHSLLGTGGVCVCVRDTEKEQERGWMGPAYVCQKHFSRDSDKVVLSGYRSETEAEKDVVEPRLAS